MGSSRTKAQTRVPCIGRWILNHCTTREAPHCFLISLFSPGSLGKGTEQWQAALVYTLRNVPAFLKRQVRHVELRLGKAVGIVHNHWSAMPLTHGHSWSLLGPTGPWAQKCHQLFLACPSNWNKSCCLHSPVTSLSSIFPKAALPSGFKLWLWSLFTKETKVKEKSSHALATHSMCFITHSKSSDCHSLHHAFSFQWEPLKCLIPY